jgi:transcriptional regulator with PAS, ATPase and Fis domain
MSESASDLIGASPAMTVLRREVAVAARSNAKVVITGESGAGKEITARALHAASRRCLRPFRAINCSSIPDELLESELFGHMRGSFTGAVRDRQGAFEAAHGGTVLLDHIADSSLRMQALLLRFLQFGEVQKIGDDLTKYVDVRIVATAHGDLLEQVSAGAFRLDLYYRLNVIRIHVPPLRERPEDIPALLEYFTMKFSHHYQVPCPPIGGNAMAWLKEYSWPGNVRELRNVAERFVIRRELLEAVECPA